MSAMNTLKKFGLEQAFNYVYKDPDKNFIKIMDWADKFSGGGFPTQRAMIREAISDPEHPYYPFIHRLVTDIDPHVMKTLAANLSPYFLSAVSMRILLAGRNRMNAVRNMAVISRGRFFLIQQVHVICTVQDAGQQSMETS